MDIEKFIEGLHDYLGKQFSPLLTRLVDLERLCGEQAKTIKALTATIDSQEKSLVRLQSDADGLKERVTHSVTVQEHRSLADLVGMLEPVPERLQALQTAINEEKTLAVGEAEQRSKRVYEVLERLNALEAAPKPEDGKSVTVEDVQPMIADLVGKAVAAIEIPKPEDGKSVTVEDVQPMIADLVGKAVAAIPRAKDGRDAAHLEVLPSIDMAKSYDRGTYARHAGGLWRSFETTHEMRGWECIVRGIQSFDVQDDGNRMIILAGTLSDGTDIGKAIKYPVLLDQGVYRSDSTYERGDVVSYGGSMWIAQVEQPKAAPGLSEEWRLSVKRGAPGKSGTPAVPRGPIRLGD